LNKIIIGVIIIIVTIGIFGFTYGIMIGQTKNQDTPDIISKSQSSGKNITLDLSESLNMRATP